MEILRVVAVLCALGCFCITEAGAASLYLDTFQGDSDGSFPGSPDVGTRTFGTSGTYTVVDLGGGDLRMRSEDTSTQGGYKVEFLPESKPESGFVSYDFKIEPENTSGDIGQALNPFMQALVFDPAPDSLAIYWSSSDSKVYLNKDRTSNATDFVWHFDTDYHVRLDFDGILDTFSLTINGMSLVSAEPFSADMIGLNYLASLSNYPMQGSSLIDNVRIESNVAPVPEPATVILLGSGLLGLAGSARKRRGKG